MAKMVSPETVLSPAKQEDASDLASLTQKNWLYETIYPFLYPQCWEDPASVHSNILAYEKKTLWSSKIETIKATDAEGKLIAAGRWTLVDPEASEDEDEGEGEPKGKPPEGSAEFRKATMQAAGKQFEEKLKGLKHFGTDLSCCTLHEHHCENLTVLRAHQSQCPPRSSAPWIWHQDHAPLSDASRRAQSPCLSHVRSVC